MRGVDTVQLIYILATYSIFTPILLLHFMKILCGYYVCLYIWRAEYMTC